MKFCVDRYHAHPPPPPPHSDYGHRHHGQEHFFKNSQVRIFTQDSYRYIICNGLPSHEIDASLSFKGANPVRPQQYFFRIPLNPNIAKQPGSSG